MTNLMNRSVTCSRARINANNRNAVWSLKLKLTTTAAEILKLNLQAAHSSNLRSRIKILLRNTRRSFFCGPLKALMNLFSSISRRLNIFYS